MFFFALLFVRFFFFEEGGSVGFCLCFCLVGFVWVVTALEL